MTKCRKAKNPCKICLETVKKKTGVQCQGQCREWVHYKCMAHPTKGRLSDIKAGILKIFCPCPDCRANNATKECYIDKKGFTCRKPGCPATQGALCDNFDCPNNTNMCRPGKMCAKSATNLGNYFPSDFNPCAPPPACVTSCCSTGAPPTLATAANKDEPVPKGRSSKKSKSKQSKTKKGNTKAIGAGVKAKGSDSKEEVNIEEVCAAVGQLTDQVNKLLKKLKCQV